MKGFQPLFLGIFGIFAFSWLGMTVVPNLQIGALNPQSDEEGIDIYPLPASGMAARGAQVYAANGCFYCHSQQVRPDYAGSDLERKWGDRRSAPRDYIFEPIAFLGNMRMGPDLANAGHRPALQEAGAASPSPAASASPAPAGAPAPANQPGTPAASPGAAPGGAAAAASPASPTTSPAPAVAAASPAAAAASPAPNAAANLPPAGAQPAANVPTSAPSMVAEPQQLTPDGKPMPYTAAWHHRHLYNPRSVTEDSNMPAYRFLYKKRRISGSPAFDALNFVGDPSDEPEAGYQIVPSYDAQCLVAYLMSRNQSHPLKEATAAATTAPPAAAAGAASPAKEGQK
jgi:cbb3-type cytochrome oxidase cytochrome c subunit